MRQERRQDRRQEWIQFRGVCAASPYHRSSGMSGEIAADSFILAASTCGKPVVLILAMQRPG